MPKTIFIILTLAGYASGAEFEIPARLSVDGASVFRGSLAVVNASTQTPYSLAVGTSTNYSLTVSTGGNLQVGGNAQFSGTIFQGTYTLLNSSMLDGFTLKLDTTTNKIKLADRIEQNIMLDAFKIAVSSSLSIFNMVDGIMDEFEDETGVDKINSSSQTYNAAGRYYSPLVSGGGIDSNTKLMLHFNSLINGSKEIQDSGSTGHIVTQVGTAALSTAQKKIGNCSLSLNGSSDYLTMPTSTDFDFGAGDFTIDFWMSLAVTNKDMLIVNYFYDTVAGGHSWDFDLTGNRLRLWAVNNGLKGDTEMGSAYNFNANQWYHVAGMVHNGVGSIYIDGVKQATNEIAAWSDIGTIAAATFNVGIYANGSYFNGYIDELRISKGIARWTTTFTPQITPYTSDDATKLLLHMESLDVSGTTPKIPTFVGTAQLTIAQKEFGTASLFLNGSSDYVSVPDSDDWYFGNGLFTIDAWVYFTSLPSVGGNIVSQVQTVNTTFYDFSFASNTLEFFVLQTSAYQVCLYADWTPSVSTWYHVAVVRVGTGNTINDWKLFVNGSELTTNKAYSGSTGTVPNFSANLNIGARVGMTYAYYFPGYIDEIRVSKGIARWTTNFTPPATEYSTATAATYDMTLVSTVTTAMAVPSNARLVLFEEDVDTVALNSDMKAYVTGRDTASWTQVSLADEGNYQSGRRILSGMVGITAASTGTAMRWKVETHNSKNIRLHGAGLNWD